MGRLEGAAVGEAMTRSSQHVTGYERGLCGSALRHGCAVGAESAASEELVVRDADKMQNRCGSPAKGAAAGAAVDGRMTPGAPGRMTHAGGSAEGAPRHRGR